jgi:hypothetical protein
MRKIGCCFSLAGAALLVSCATPAPAPTQASTEKFQIPIGYQKTKMNGEDRYCRTDMDTGSHISRTTTCYTLAQLQSQATDVQNSISSQIQNSNQFGTAMGAGGPTGPTGGGAIGR